MILDFEMEIEYADTYVITLASWKLCQPPTDSLIFH